MIRPILLTVILFVGGYILAKYFKTRIDRNLDDDLFLYLIIASTILIFIAIQGFKLTYEFISNLF